MPSKKKKWYWFTCTKCGKRFQRITAGEGCSSCGGRLTKSPDIFSLRLDKQRERIQKELGL